MRLLDMFIESKNSLFLLLFLVVLLVACGKDDDQVPPQADKEQMLVNNEWVLSNLQMNPPIEGVNPYEFLEDCYVDNIYTFLEDNVLSVDEGPEKCDENSPQTLVGEWQLNADQSQLTIKYATYNQTFIIEELSDQEMRLQAHVTFQGFSIPGVFTFTKL